MTSIVKHQKPSLQESSEVKHHLDFVSEGVFYYADDIFFVRDADNLEPVKLTPSDGRSQFEIFSAKCSHCSSNVVILFRDASDSQGKMELSDDYMDFGSDGDEPYNPVGAVAIDTIKRPRIEQ